MNSDLKQYFKLISELQTTVSRSDSMDEALKSGLQLLKEKSAADHVILWYAGGDAAELHPYYWICPADLTSLKAVSGEGIVGRAFQEKQALGSSDIDASQDPDMKNLAAWVETGDVFVVPFSDQLKGVGCLEFTKEKGSEPFNDDDKEVFQILTLLTEMNLAETIDLSRGAEEREALLTIRNITKDYQNGGEVIHALKGIDINVYDGEFLVFLGESGCGKSTVLNIIGGMDRPTSGTVTFMNEDLSAADEEALTRYRRDNVGFIFQSYNLMPNLTASQNLNLIGELVTDPMDTGEVLDMIGLSEKKNNYPSQLSGGQQQRVSIGRALIKKPKLILADEPTAALDYATSIEVLEVLEKVVHSGTTLVMVTHNEEITRMADRVVRFRDGRVYETTVNRNPAKARDLVW